MTKSDEKHVSDAPVSDFSQCLTNIAGFVNGTMPGVNGDIVFISHQIELDVVRFIRSQADLYKIEFFSGQVIDPDFLKLKNIVSSLIFNTIASKLK